MSYSWMFGDVTVPNERSRAYLAASLVDDHSLAIDTSVERFGRVADVATHEGRLYTDKAPGSSLLGALVYGAAELFVDRRSLRIAELIHLERRGLMLPFAALGFWLFRRVLRKLSASEHAVDIASLSLFLGTAFFHYGAAYFGHALAAIFLLAAFALLLPGTHGNEGSWYVRPLAAGAAAGMAGLTEYQAIPVAGWILLLVAHRSRSQPTRIVPFILGAVPFAAALLAYNTFAFGDPLELPYEHLANSQVQARHTRGIAGVGLPTFEATWGSLFSLHRGLIAITPIAALFPLGLVRLARTGHRDLAWFLAVSVGTYLLFIFGADMWYGGWGFGPRLLVPCLPYVFVGVALALDPLLERPSYAVITMGAAAFGVVYVALVTQTFAELPEDMQRPLADIVLPALLSGHHAPNLLTELGARFGTTTLLPAWLLTCVALGCIALGSTLSRSTLRSRALSGMLALAVTAVGITVLAKLPKSVADDRQRRFLTWMQGLQDREHRDRARP